jgi:flagellar motor switch protein FliN/FliY
MESIHSFDVKNKIVGSVREVFDMMLSMDLEFDQRVAQNYMFGNRVLGTINLVGTVMGIVTIQVSEKFSRMMTGKMLDLEPDDIQSMDEIKDVIGELLNMIGGNLKSCLCDADLNCNLSTPALTTGKDYKFETKEMTRNEYFNLYYQDEAILVHVGLKNQDADAVQEMPAPEVLNINNEVDFDSFQIDNSILGAVSDVFDTMLDIEIERCVGELDKNPNEIWIVGSISLSGVVMGRVNIHISELFSRIMTATMLGIEPEEIENFAAVKDCVGEVCNMISGNLKSALNDAGMPCLLSPPSFTSGSDFEMDMLNMRRVERFEFCHQDHDILVEVGLKPSNE